MNGFDMKKVLFALALISLNANAAFKALNLTTSIDVVNLYKDAIISVEFFPSILELEASQGSTKFSDVVTTLKIETDIGLEASTVPYISTLTENTTNCVDYSGETSIQHDFVNEIINGQSISKGQSVSFANFDLDDGVNKYSEHSVMLSFKPFNDINTAGQPESCNGEIEFSIEVDI